MSSHRCSLRVAALAAFGLLLGATAPAAAGPLPERLGADLERARSGHPTLLRLRPDAGGVAIADVDERALAALLAEVSGGTLRPATRSALRVLFDGLARQQATLAAWGRVILADALASAVASGDAEVLRGMAELLAEVMEDPANQYSLLAQDLLSEKARCGAASLGDDALLDELSRRVHPDREFREFARTDGTVADRYGLHQTADLYAVAARDERVLAVGYWGTLLVSRDAGRSFTAVPAGIDEPLYVAALGPGDEMWAAGRAGTVLRSTDAGSGWRRVRPPFARHLFGLHALGPGAVLAVGDFGLQLVTRDGGERWACLPREDDVILGRIATAGEDAVVAGEFGTLERWRASRPPPRRGRIQGVPDDVYLFDVWFHQDGRTGVAVGVAGTVLRSDDAGSSWDPVPVPFEADLYGVGGFGERVAIVGEGGWIAVSRDGGRSFEPAHTPPLPLPLLDVAFANADTAIAVGARGTVLTSRDGGRRFERTRPSPGGAQQRAP